MNGISQILRGFAGLILPVLSGGTAWLVGAGPGDPGLPTIHALHAMQQADLIVYDALVSDDVLTLARPPLAVISDATTPRQRVMVSTLARAKSDVDEQGLAAPAIIAIGEIVRLRAGIAPLAIGLEGSQ